MAVVIYTVQVRQIKTYDFEHFCGNKTRQHGKHSDVSLDLAISAVDHIVFVTHKVEQASGLVSSRVFKEEETEEHQLVKVVLVDILIILVHLEKVKCLKDTLHCLV